MVRRIVEPCFFLTIQDAGGGGYLSENFGAVGAAFTFRLESNEGFLEIGALL